MKTNICLNMENFYWEQLQNLSTDIKLRLIARLSESIVNQSEARNNNNTADRFYGAWADDKSAEEIIQEIHDSRTFQTRNIETLE